jgi:hypothetical protein
MPHILAMVDQEAVLGHPLVRMLQELGKFAASPSAWFPIEQHRYMRRVRIMEQIVSCCPPTGYAHSDGTQAIALKFQQFLDTNGKTLQQQGAGDADLNAVLDFFAAGRGSTSNPADDAMSDERETGA